MRDPVAKEHFLTPEADIDSALLRVSVVAKKTASPGDLPAELDSVLTAMKNVPWTEIEALRDDPVILKKLNDVEDLLANLRKTLSS